MHKKEYYFLATEVELNSNMEKIFKFPWSGY